MLSSTGPDSDQCYQALGALEEIAEFLLNESATRLPPSLAAKQKDIVDLLLQHRYKKANRHWSACRD